MTRKETLEIMTQKYLETAAWADAPEECEDGSAQSMEFTLKAKAQAKRDCAAFLDMAAPKGWTGDCTPGQLGHNFWLSRNGHGAGFFEVGLEYSAQLQGLAESFGSEYLYVTRGKLAFG